MIARDTAMEPRKYEAYEGRGLAMLRFFKPTVGALALVATMSATAMAQSAPAAGQTRFARLARREP